MSSTVEHIKERIGIVEVVSSYIKLEKAGRNFKARCPFHTERTPSFFVSPERETYHCFGCGKGGDIFSFVEEIEGVDFSGALKILAERTGVPVPTFDGRGEDARKRIYALIESAASFFEENLKRESAVLAYLSSRGLKEKTIEDWRIGYAQNDWRALYTFLRGKKYSDEEMTQAGLVAASGDRVYDRFRGRIMFPVTDQSGRTVAFSGRIFPGAYRGSEAEQAAKYINSPETALYSKSRILYGFHKAKQAIRSKNTCVVVEGQLDVLMSHQAGVNESVAVSGTALTEHHLSLIGRFTNNIVLAFDADQAGFKAADRSIKGALSSGFSVSIARLPKGSDPADIVRSDEKKWEESVRSAQHTIEFFLSVFSEEHLDSRTLHLKIQEYVIPFVAHLKSPLEQAHFVKRIAERAKIEENPVWEALKKHERQREYPQAGREKEALPVLKEDQETERLKKIRNRIYGIFLWQSNHMPGENLNAFRERYEGLYGGSLEKEIQPLSPEEKNRLIFEAEVAYANSENFDAVFQELFLYFETELLRLKQRELMETLKQAEKEGDEAKALQILTSFNELTERINKLGTASK